MKRTTIASILYNFLQGIRSDLEDRLGTYETEDILEMAAHPSNWVQIEAETLHPDSEKYGHAPGATCYRFWRLATLQDIKVHIWHNRDMLLHVQLAD